MDEEESHRVDTGGSWRRRLAAPASALTLALVVLAGVRSLMGRPKAGRSEAHQALEPGGPPAGPPPAGPAP
jgi:hypothetical protein